MSNEVRIPDMKSVLEQAPWHWHCANSAADDKCIADRRRAGQSQHRLGRAQFGPTVWGRPRRAPVRISCSRQLLLKGFLLGKRSQSAVGMRVDIVSASTPTNG
jgi:hypothetical protein